MISIALRVDLGALEVCLRSVKVMHQVPADACGVYGWRSMPCPGDASFVTKPRLERGATSMVSACLARISDHGGCELGAPWWEVGTYSLFYLLSIHI